MPPFNNSQLGILNPYGDSLYSKRQNAKLSVIEKESWINENTAHFVTSTGSSIVFVFNTFSSIIDDWQNENENKLINENNDVIGFLIE